MVRHKMAELGRTVSEAQAEKLLALVKEKAVELNRPLNDEDVATLVGQVSGQTVRSQHSRLN